MPLINVTVAPDAVRGGVHAGTAGVHTVQPKLSEALDMFLDLYGLTQGKKVSCCGHSTAV